MSDNPDYWGTGERIVKLFSRTIIHGVLSYRGPQRTHNISPLIQRFS